MSDLTQARRATERKITGFDVINEFEVVTAAVLFGGGMAGTDATGKLQRASAAGTMKVVGAACRDVLTTEPAGTLLKVQQGIFRFANSGTAPLTDADRWKPCYVEDDQTVAASGQLFAGTVYDVDANGVWVAIFPEVNNEGGGGLGNLLAGGAALTVAGESTVITATDNAVITLPSAASSKGKTIRVLCSAADGAALVSISPQSTDAIVGTIANAAADSVSGGVANKDWRLTKATQNKGDYCDVQSDGVTTWYIVGGVGIWASEP